MRALILNSGAGTRMMDLTHDCPKCMTVLHTGQTILSRQIEQLERHGIREICITTGPFADILERHALEAAGSAALFFVNNPEYLSTNYIYSIFLAKEFLRGDILLLHGDLVFSDCVLRDILKSPVSAAVVSTVLPLPEKDFKAVVIGGLISKVGVEFFEDAVALQPLYKLNEADWFVWLSEIESFIARGEKRCYAENALNAVSGYCAIYPFDIGERLCAEIDNPDDLVFINAGLKGVEAE